MRRIAITGGIGCGKSYVCAMLRERGFKVYDCDSAAKRLMLESADVRDKLISLLGDNAYIDGRLNKPLLRNFILSGESSAHKVNSIVHPAVAQDFFLSGIQTMECAILFSSGFYRLVDKVICVSAPYDVRLKRVISRDGISEEKAAAWINKQMCQDEVESRSDYIISNDGDSDIAAQLNRVIELFYTK